MGEFTYADEHNAGNERRKDDNTFSELYNTVRINREIKTCYCPYGEPGDCGQLERVGREAGNDRLDKPLSPYGWKAGLRQKESSKKNGGHG